MEEEVKRRGRPAKDARRSETREKFDRSRRVPMGGPDLKLEVHDKDEDYVYRWFNDKGSRIQKAKAASYEFVNDSGHVGSGAEDRNSDVGSGVSQIVGTKEDGSALRAHLMRIPRELYEEDQAAKQAPIDEMEDQLFNGGMQENPNLGRGDSYVPSEGRKRRVSVGK